MPVIRLPAELRCSICDQVLSFARVCSLCGRDMHEWCGKMVQRRHETGFVCLECLEEGNRAEDIQDGVPTR
jgi:hypothetical protein